MQKSMSLKHEPASEPLHMRCHGGSIPIPVGNEVERGSGLGAFLVLEASHRTLPYPTLPYPTLPYPTLPYRNECRPPTGPHNLISLRGAPPFSMGAPNIKTVS